MGAEDGETKCSIGLLGRQYVCIYQKFGGLDLGGLGQDMGRGGVCTALDTPKGCEYRIGCLYDRMGIRKWLHIGSNGKRVFECSWYYL